MIHYYRRIISNITYTKHRFVQMGLEIKTKSTWSPTLQLLHPKIIKRITNSLANLSRIPLHLKNLQQGILQFHAKEKKRKNLEAHLPPKIIIFPVLLLQNFRNME